MLLAWSASSWTAFGTLALAAVTAITAGVAGWSIRGTKKMIRATEDQAASTRLMAEETKKAAEATARDADASLQQAQQARLALEASTTPLLGALAPDDQGPSGNIRFPDGSTAHLPQTFGPFIALDGQGLRAAFSLRNLGVGPAVVTGLSLQFGEHYVPSGAVSSSVVCPGEKVRFTFQVPRSRGDVQDLFDQVQNQAVGTLLVSYADIRGTQKLSTIAHLFAPPGRGEGLRVRQVAFRRDDDHEPFVMSGPQGD